jgi:hypothetical protein
VWAIWISQSPLDSHSHACFPFLPPQRKRALTICNLFINHNMSISNIERVLDEDHGKIVQALIESGILYDRRQIAGRLQVGIERGVPQRKVKL